MTDADRARELTNRALEEFDSGKSTSALVRRAHRIAVLRHDYAAQAWFLFQQRDLKSAPNHDDLLAVKAKLVALLGDEAGSAEYIKQAESFMSSRAMLDESGNRYMGSVDQIEAMLGQLEEAVAGREIPPNLHSLDAGMEMLRQNDTRTKLWPNIVSFRNMLARIRSVVHVYLVATEAELDAGRQESSFLDVVYSRINSLLNTYAADAAEKFIAAQDRVTSGGQEDISHALTSCRRMIKSLADTLYPPTDKDQVGLDGVPRKMSDDAYKNRLLQYVREQVGKHKSGAVLQQVISDLGKRLDTLDALSSKGVHADASIAEAHTCVMQTYLLSGDLLAIAEGTSLLMHTDNEPQPDPQAESS